LRRNTFALSASLLFTLLSRSALYSKLFFSLLSGSFFALYALTLFSLQRFGTLALNALLL
jgi:hypothetical protein